MSKQLADLLVGSTVGLGVIIAAITVGVLMYQEFLLDGKKYPKAKGYVRSAKMSTQLVAGGIVYAISLLEGFFLSASSSPLTSVDGKTTPAALPAYDPPFLVALGIYYALLVVSFFLVIPVVARTYIVMRREDEKGDQIVQEAEALLKRKAAK